MADASATVSAGKAFFAYPSRPRVIRETILRAARNVHRYTGLGAVPWEDLATVGHGPVIIQNILDAIDEAIVSVFDVTTLNENVMFELGYAIGREKRIWLLRDPSHAAADRAWQEFNVLSGIRYTTYANAEQISTTFSVERPWEKAETAFSQLIDHSLEPASVRGLLLMKSRHDTDAARELSRKANEHRRRGIPVVVDDPSESVVQPLSWYVQQAYVADAVIVHLAGPGRVGAELHNARCSLIAGIAHGMQRPVLLLAEADYLAPLDYRDLLKVYRSADDAATHAEEWLATRLAGAAEALKRGAAMRTRLRLATELRSLRLGEPVAEMEEEWLEDYFVPTAAFDDVLSPKTTVFVGRKGTGKTANMLRAAQVLEGDRRNLVCLITPASYELEGLVRLLRLYSERDAKGYLIEALWKFLLLSEIALAAYRDTRRGGRLIQPGTAEDAFVRFMETNPFLLEEFAVRLEQAVDSVLSGARPQGVGDARAAISEQLHGGVLQELRLHLGLVLGNRERVAVLIDNLDKAWERSADIQELSYLLLGLLAAVGPVGRDFAKADRWRRAVRVSVAIFLRSDIYSRVAKVAREPDRIPVTRLLWNDGEILLRVVEERYKAARNFDVEGSELWDKFFVPLVLGRPVRDYIRERVLARPRDLVVFCNAAIATAVNRGHEVIEADDVLEAERTYSLFALEAVKVENGITAAALEEVLYEFAGAPHVMPQDEALGRISRVPSAEAKAAEVLEHLRGLSFLGIETAPDRYSFAEEPLERVRDDALARRFAESHGRSPRVTIHPAFRRYLEVREGEGRAQEDTG